MCLRARACVNVRETEISGGCMYVCVRVGVWEAVICVVYGCGCEGGQDENNDYTYAEFIAY